MTDRPRSKGHRPEDARPIAPGGAHDAEASTDDRRIQASRHPYGCARSQYAELFRPRDGEPPFPVAVVIHGGFWRAAYGRKLMHDLCADLTARGWAAWNVEYRRIGRLSGGGYPR